MGMGKKSGRRSGRLENRTPQALTEVSSLLSLRVRSLLSVGVNVGLSTNSKPGECRFHFFFLPLARGE